MSQHELVLSPRRKYILYSITTNAMPAQRVSVASMEAVQRISKPTTPTAPLHVTCPLLSVICPFKRRVNCLRDRRWNLPLEAM